MWACRLWELSFLRTFQVHVNILSVVFTNSGKHSHGRENTLPVSLLSKESERLLVLSFNERMIREMLRWFHHTCMLYLPSNVLIPYHALSFYNLAWCHDNKTKQKHHNKTFIWTSIQEQVLQGYRYEIVQLLNLCYSYWHQYVSVLLRCFPKLLKLFFFFFVETLYIFFILKILWWVWSLKQQLLFKI